MPDLIPYPFAALCRRAFRELENQGAIFDLPQSRFVCGDPRRDLSVRFHDRRASSPLGPAAGPHTQMAQNIVLSWLGGCRIQELKTVQILDQLEIPRPCIDMHTYGLNVEWSQELTLEQSLDEYVKGAMLVEMLRSGPVSPEPDFGESIYDLSVGYDLEGIRSERVGAFVRGMLDAGPTIERLRGEIPPELASLRELDFERRLSDSVTLSTFHGCPPDEIERIIDYLMREHSLHSTIKFNPTLLGSEGVHDLLQQQLGYSQVTVPTAAFDRDTKWQQAIEMLERLSETAEELGLGLGAKFSNTLIVKNDRGFLAPGEKEAYLSGGPLHVLAMHLVRRFRREFGDRFPISFAAGIDRRNYPDAVALGLVPITVCSDLLKKGGYARLEAYDRELSRRMDEVGAAKIDDFVLLAYDQAAAALDQLGLEAGDPTLGGCRAALDLGEGMREAAGEDLFGDWVAAAKLLNTEVYVERLDSDERYHAEQNTKGPRKIGRRLKLFDCLTCDICVPVCPNDANFTLPIGPCEVPVIKVAFAPPDGWQIRREEPLVLSERHQIASFVDFCNDCGNCDIFCPEDGGPYKLKPRFFGSEAVWRGESVLDGFFVEHRKEGDRVLGRFEGCEYELVVERSNGGRFLFTGEGFVVRFEPQDAEATLSGEAEDDLEIDLTYGFLMNLLREAVLDPEHCNYIGSLSAAGEGGQS